MVGVSRRQWPMGGYDVAAMGETLKGGYEFSFELLLHVMILFFSWFRFLGRR